MIDVVRLGGGFGGKEDQATPWAIMAGLGAQILQKPVKVVLSRMDDMRMTGKRHPYAADYKIGFSEDHKILPKRASTAKRARASSVCSSSSSSSLSTSVIT